MKRPLIDEYYREIIRIAPKSNISGLVDLAIAKARLKRDIGKMIEPFVKYLSKIINKLFYGNN